MPKGTIYTANDRSISKYDRALKSKSKNLGKARDEAMKNIKKKVPMSPRHDKKSDGSYERVMTRDAPFLPFKTSK